MSTDLIINTKQAQILQVLADHAGGAPILSQVHAAAGKGLSRSGFDHAMTDLRERGMITTHKVPGATARAGKPVYLEMIGTRALAQYHARCAEEAARIQQANRIVRSHRDNLFERPVLVLPHFIYSRNNGHTHIASRGVGC
jgi:hypothetical protein